MIQFVSDRSIYETMIRDAVPKAARRVWIVTADIKDLYVEAAAPFSCWHGDCEGTSISLKINVREQR